MTRFASSHVAIVRVRPISRYRPAGVMTTGDDETTPACCAWCGRTEPDGPPLGWSVQASERGVQTLCEACTRVNVRSIEAKLDSEWW